MLRRIGSSRSRATATIFLCAFFLSAGISAFISPRPLVNDEFSYLLAADTFLSGRLVNPVHPLREMFETYHVIHDGVYASKYPPAQGLFLALGKLVFGKFIYGVALSAGLALACLYWMLDAWVPRRWAWWGTWCALVPLVGFSYWSQSFWGGFPAMAAGCLIVGAAGRLSRGPSRGGGMATGLGISLGLASRPYETLTFGAPWLICLAARLVEGLRKRERRRWTQFVLVPAFSIVALTCSLLIYDAWRVTGRLFVAPQDFYQKKYATTPIATIGDTRFRESPAVYHGLGLTYARFARWEESYIRAFRAHPWKNFWGRFESFWGTFLGPLLTLPLLFLFHLRRRAEAPRAIISLACGGAGHMLVYWYFPHYSAPGVASLWLLIVNGARHLRVVGRRKRWGVTVTKWLPVAQLGGLSLGGALLLNHSKDPHLYPHWQLFPKVLERIAFRNDIASRLEQKPGKFLVIVDYSADYQPPEELVHNEADIDASKIVWARFIPEKIMKLVDYFRERTVFVLHIDNKSANLVPFEASS